MKLSSRQLGTQRGGEIEGEVIEKGRHRYFQMVISSLDSFSEQQEFTCRRNTDCMKYRQRKLDHRFLGYWSVHFGSR